MLQWIVGLIAAVILVLSPIFGYISSPLAPFWLSGKNAVPPPAVVETHAETAPTSLADGLVLVPFPGDTGARVTDVQRFRLARAAGWSVEDAIIATAISIAEDGSGDPAALSPLNSNGTRDLGLWQINSIHWAGCGGQVALIVPINNVRCAFSIWAPGRSWCPWSTYERSCGIGHNSSYAAFLDRARKASQVPVPPNEA